MLFTIVSKDKITLSMFVDFYRTLYDSDVQVVDLNTLISNDMIDSIVKSAMAVNMQRALSKDSTLLIKLKSKKNMTLEDLPREVVGSSTYVVQFGLFSTKPEVLKDKDGTLPAILERWETNIEKMNK